MTTALLATAPPGEWKIHEQGLGLVKKKHGTILKSIVVSIEWLKRTCTLSPSTMHVFDTISTGAQGIRALSNAAAAIPSIFKLIESAADLTQFFKKSPDSGPWITTEKVKTFAGNLFSSSGDIAYLTVAAHKFGFIHIAKAVPGLQIFATSVFGITAIKKISEAWSNSKLATHTKMLTTAKETCSVSLGALGIVALTVSSQALSIAILVASTAWIAIDLTQYCLSDPPPMDPQPPQEIDVEDLERYFA